MVCLDTDVLIGLLRKNPEAKLVFEKTTAEGMPLKTTVFSAYELFKGTSKGGGARTNAAEALLEKMEIIYPSISSARIYGQEYQRLKESGRMSPEFDLMIASVCIAENEVLITRNAKDFEKIQGLKVKRW